jgi:hypothetical protein
VNGAEHFRAAEEDMAAMAGKNPQAVQALLARAQVHATLAGVYAHNRATTELISVLHALWEARKEAAPSLALLPLREQIGKDIEAAIVTDPANRCARWPCTCPDGSKCYPHLATEAMNRVTAADWYEDAWPVIQAGALWDALEPVILRAAASIARNDADGGARPRTPSTSAASCWSTCGSVPHDNS